jgi:cytoskeletal protein CcmA (bactofilin family)
MFSGNKKESSKSKSSSIMPSAASHSLNSLVQGTVVEGAVKSESDIRVDGTIKGNLICDAKVIIGPTGYVHGEIRCKNAVIEGKFEGKLQVNELLNIREDANVSGEVSTNKLIVQSGAIFNVSCNMGAGGLKSKSSPTVPEHTNNEKENLTDKEKVGKAKPAGV